MNLTTCDNCYIVFDVDKILGADVVMNDNIIQMCRLLCKEEITIYRHDYENNTSKSD